MANRYKNLIYSNAEYTHSYRGFRGVELNGSSVTSSQSRLALAQNMFKDYDGDGADVIESVPGFRCFAHYGQKAHAIYYQHSPFGDEDHLIVHIGDKILRHPVSDTHRKSSTGTLLAYVNDGKSFGFEYGKHFYIMDTRNILQISDNGTTKVIGDSGSKPYTPTIYVSGEAYEQRNLLTDSFKEEYYIADPGVYLFATKGLKYNVTDPNLRYCAVNGIGEAGETELYIPAYVSIAGISYKVMSISDGAFRGNTSLQSVYLPDGITVIGKSAFSGCTSLKTVVMSSTVIRIEDAAFSGCSAMTKMYLGAATAYIGNDALKNCSELSSVNYALTSADLGKISGHDSVVARSVVYNSTYRAVKLSLPLHDKVKLLNSVMVDGKSVEWSTVRNESEPTGVVLSFSELAAATGIKVTVEGVLAPLGSDWSADMHALATVSPLQAIINCRIAEVFDGRIFFSGNPVFPNTVFYTERPRPGKEAALYIGRYGYFNDGVGSYKVKSMLAVRDMLAVFKEGDDGSGSIFYHKKEGTAIDALDTIYPVAYTHSGICSTGTCLSFLDDPVFLTNEGLMALNSENINYQRNVVCRSHNVNYNLLKENLSEAALGEWLGYLVVGVCGKIYLADSRAVFSHPTGSYEYEWFVLTDIGAHDSDSNVFRYYSEPHKDTVAHPTRIGEAVPIEDVFCVTDSNGVDYAYVYEDGTKYRVIKTEELSGGEFLPATTYAFYGNLLFFATDDGHLCVFNNDMRGVAPDSVKEAEGYDEEEYLATMGNTLHPFFYSFAGHAPKYVVKTALDDCGVPHLTKNTVKGSLVIKARSAKPDAIVCEVSTDATSAVKVASFPPASTGFEGFSFDVAPWYVSRYNSIALPENKKRWIEKQITLTSSGFESPIAVYSISYRYTIKGKIKNNA